MDLKGEKENIININDKLFQKILHLTCATNGYCDASLQLINSEYLTKKERDIMDYILSFKRTNGTYPRYSDVVFRFKGKKDIDLEIPITYSYESQNKNEEKTKEQNKSSKSDKENFNDFVNEFLWNKKKLLIIKKIEKFISKLVNGTISEDFIRDFNNLLYDTYPYAIPDTVQRLQERFTNNSMGLNTGVEEINILTDGFKRKQLVTIAGDKNSYCYYSNTLLIDAIKNNLNVCYISFNSSSDIVLCRLLSSLSENILGKKINYNNILLGSKYNSDTFKKVLQTFTDNYSKNISFIDNDNFETFDLDWLSKLLFSVNRKFYETTNRPIDIIFVEGLENAKLEKNFNVISSSTSISNAYINYLKHYANEHNIAVLIFTSLNGKSFRNIAYRNGFMDFTDTVPHIDVMSDIFILCKYIKIDNPVDNDEALIGQFMFQLVKSPLGITQEEPTTIDIKKDTQLLLENDNN